MNRAQSIDLLGLHSGKREVPSDIFVIRPETDEELLRPAVSQAICRLTAPGKRAANGNGNAPHELRPIDFGEHRLSAALGISATSPETFLYQVRANDELGIRIHEL